MKVISKLWNELSLYDKQLTIFKIICAVFIISACSLMFLGFVKIAFTLFFVLMIIQFIALLVIL
jgi:hypothetical protein